MSGLFVVSQSRDTLAHLKHLIEILRVEGKGEVTGKSLRWIHEELTRTPMEFGESRYRLEQLDLNLRIAFTGTLAVEYAVNEAGRQVFIRRWALQKE
jgi:hypothetical protein